MADIKWIKLSVGLFDNRKIKQIRKIPDGDAIIGVWLQILCLAGKTNDNGLVYFSEDLPYTDEMLATEFERPLNVIRLSLSTFIKFKMIEVHDDMLLVSNWEKYQSADKLNIIKEQNRVRQQNYRDRQKQLADSNVTVTLHNATELELELELDKELDKDKDIMSENKFSDDSIPVTLSKLLHQLKIEHIPKAKEPNYQKWAEHIDKMQRIDGITFEEIEDLIRWCQQDNFWKTNILSTQKLREKYEQLYAAKARDKGSGKSDFDKKLERLASFWMTREEFKNIVAGLMSNYPGLKIDNTAQFNFWYESLKDLDYQLCQIGIMKMVQTLKFTPTIANIREACTIDNSLPVAEAWDTVMSCVRYCGSYREAEALEGMDPTTRRVVESIGYRNLCMSENIMADRAHFIKLYEQMATRERQDKLLPVGLQEKLKLMSEKFDMKRLEVSDG